MISVFFLIFFGISTYMLFKRMLGVNGVPLYPGWLPLLGHGLVFMQSKGLFSVVKDLGSFSLKNRGVSIVSVGRHNFYVVANIEDATTALTNCLEKNDFYKFIEPLFGDLLVSAEATVWKRNRRLVDLAFKQQILGSYINIFNVEATRLLSALAKRVAKEEIDITDDLTRNVLNTSFQTTLGKIPSGVEFVIDRYVKSIHKVFEIVNMRVHKPWFLSDVIFNLSYLKKEFDDSLEVIHKLSDKMVQIRKKEFLEQKENRSSDQNNDDISFLYIILENSLSDEGSMFTDLQLRYLCNNVLLAAFDTTTYELLYALICIGSDAAVQDRIYREIIEVLGEETLVNQQHLSRLKYLEAAIKEALRLYPIAPGIARKVTTEIHLDKCNVTVPVGSSIWVHIWAINRNKAYWGSDAEEYNPGRWMDPTTLPYHPNAFGSFSFGRRNCVGKQYTMMHMKITLAAIIRNFVIISDHKKMIFDLFVMIKTKSGHLVKLEPR